jgi:hypothetical protein
MFFLSFPSIFQARERPCQRGQHWSGPRPRSGSGINRGSSQLAAAKKRRGDVGAHLCHKVKGMRATSGPAHLQQREGQGLQRAAITVKASHFYTPSRLQTDSPETKFALQCLVRANFAFAYGCWSPSKTTDEDSTNGA